MTVDLLVVNYNTKDYLKNLVEHLNLDYEPGVWKLYIQDNGSTDGSIEWMESVVADPDYHIDYYFESTNVGYAGAVNHLSRISNSDILAAVNADTQFTTRHVKQVQQSFDNHPEMAILGPKQIDSQHRIRHGGIFWRGRGDRVIHRGWTELDPRDQLYKDRVQCWTVSGSLYYVRRSVWNELASCEAYMEALDQARLVGAFLPTRHYYEETFCSVHAQKHGYQVWYDGEIETANHAWHASEPVGGAAESYWEASKDLYVKTCDKLDIVHEC